MASTVTGRSIDFRLFTKGKIAAASRLFTAPTLTSSCDGLAPIFTLVDAMPPTPTPSPPADHCSNSRLAVPFGICIFGGFGADHLMSC